MSESPRRRRRRPKYNPLRMAVIGGCAAALALGGYWGVSSLSSRQNVPNREINQVPEQTASEADIPVTEPTEKEEIDLKAIASSANEVIAEVDAAKEDGSLEKNSVNVGISAYTDQDEIIRLIEVSELFTGESNENYYYEKNAPVYIEVEGVDHTGYYLNRSEVVGVVTNPKYSEDDEIAEADEEAQSYADKASSYLSSAYSSLNKLKGDVEEENTEKKEDEEKKPKGEQAADNSGSGNSTASNSSASNSSDSSSNGNNTGSKPANGSAANSSSSAGNSSANGNSGNGNSSSSGNSSSGTGSTGNTSSGNTSGGNSSSGNTSGGNSSSGNTSGGNSSSGNTSGGNTSGNTSGGTTSSGNTSGGNTSGGNTSGNTSGGNTSGGNTSGGNTAGGSNPSSGTIANTSGPQLFPNSSTTVLTQAEVSNLTPGQAQTAINELFARKGYKFKNTALLNYYKGFDWYNPDTSDSSVIFDRFSDTESKNFNMLYGQVIGASGNTTPEGDQNPSESNPQQGSTSTGAVIPDSSSRVVTRSELDQLTGSECLLAIDEIYARHGYQFSKKKLNDYFSQFSWYQPDSTSRTTVEKRFNETEVKNFNILSNYILEKGY